MGALKHRICVPMQIIDGFIEILVFLCVDILKLDIERHEYKALLEAERAISQGKISIVASEFGIHQVESRNFFKDFHAFFTNHGYRLFKCDKLEQAQGFFLFPIEQYN